MVDAALALKSRGHPVHFVTAHHDPTHCFEETNDGLLPVTVVAEWWPRTLLGGRCQALCATVRMLLAAVWILVRMRHVELVLCDQVSAPVPLLRLFGKRVLFYCHFPDLLLSGHRAMQTGEAATATGRKKCAPKPVSTLKRWYRKPMDWLEEWSTGWAHCVLVNSRFTAGIFRRTFPSLAHVQPQVLYPVPDFRQLDAANAAVAANEELLYPADTRTLFLSVNRYERKKNVRLAVEALAELRALRCDALDGVHLVVAGGFDRRVPENAEVLSELRSAAADLHLTEHVTFLRSCSTPVKVRLMREATALLYTPQHEHFGIVPLEAMYLRCPVLAVASGGPLETVADGRTGYLCDPSAAVFAERMAQLAAEAPLSRRLGDAARAHVLSRFSFDVMTQQLAEVVGVLLTQRA